MQETAYVLYKLTDELLEAVNTLDLPRLREMVDDDFGIVDVDPEGKPMVINNMEEWETYMQKNMQMMEQVKAKLSYEISEYHEKVADHMAFVVVKFTQHVAVQEQRMQHPCIATIVWKKTGKGWQEARWHCSRLSS
jgi:hypothetical protein